MIRTYAIANEVLATRPVIIFALGPRSSAPMRAPAALQFWLTARAAAARRIGALRKRPVSSCDPADLYSTGVTTNTTVLAAVVAALAAVIGGLLAALASRGVEKMRVRAGLVEKAEERKLAAIEAFVLAVNAWVDWLRYIAEQPAQEQFEELNQRVRTRDESYRRLLLLSSATVYTWLTKVYGPAEYEFKRTYAHQVRWFQKVNEQGHEDRRQFERLLRVDLIEHLRPEVAALRDPIAATSRSRNKPMQ